MEDVNSSTKYQITFLISSTGKLFFTCEKAKMVTTIEENIDQAVKRKVILRERKTAVKELLAGRDVIAILSTGKSRKKFKNYHMYNLRHLKRTMCSENT